MNLLCIGGAWEWKSADWSGWFAWVWKGESAWGGFGETRDGALEDAQWKAQGEFNG